MTVVDVILVAALVATAAFFLAWTMLGRGPKAPSCHVTGMPLERTPPSPGAASGDVVIGASLARGLERAAAKRSSSSGSGSGSAHQPAA